MRKIFIFFLVLIMVLAGVGFWYWQKNIYSKEVVKFEIIAPEEVQAGQKVEYLVKVKNNGRVRLENVELLFRAPHQSILEESENSFFRQKIEDIYPGEERVYKFFARVFGKEGDTLQAQAFLTYRPKNLNTLFESQTSALSKISFVPLTLEFDLPSKVENEEIINFSINYFSNMDYLLKNLRLKVEYPQGFEFVSSQPQALETTDWDLPSLYKTSGGRIEIKGKISGQEQEEKVFRAVLGMIRNDEFWVLKETTQSVRISESPLYVSLSINNSLNYTAQAGDFLHYEIYFRNIGKKPIQKKFLLAELEGDFFDFSTLRSDKGESGRGDSTMIWDWKKVPKLRFLDTGEEGKVDFWVKLQDDIPRKTENPVLRVKVNVAGVERTFETKINTRVWFSQKVYFNQEVFDNSGPLPPEVGKTTQYVVFWQIRNAWNELQNVKIKAELPENVSLTGKIFPEDASLTFDSSSREVVWTLDKVEAFQGYDPQESPLTLAFQIALTPDSSQKDTIPVLIKEAELTGVDAFTGEEIKEKVPFVDTTLPDDETVDESHAIVK